MSEWMYYPWFWLVVFLIGGAGMLLISGLDRRDWKNYLKKDDNG